jgi:hypothetical protein
LPELTREEDGAPIVFLVVVVRHCTTTSRHGLDSPLHHYPTNAATMVSPRHCSPVLAAMDTPWLRHRVLPLGRAKAGPFCRCEALTRARTHSSQGLALPSHWCSRMPVPTCHTCRGRHGRHPSRRHPVSATSNR